MQRSNTFTDAPIRVCSILLILASAFLSVGSASASTPTIGLPITRTYSIEEIGVSRGPHLDFDRLGRLAVISNGSYMVLNDNAWIDLADDSNSTEPYLLEVITGNDGHPYFGALASWGKAEYTADGRLRAVSMRPDEYPEWINATNFTQIIQTPSGILFSGPNGIVHLEPETGAQTFVELSVASVFTVGSDVFVSSNASGTVLFDPLTGGTQVIDASVAVHDVAPFGDGVVAASFDGRLVYFDGTRFSDRDFGFKASRGSISCLEPLPDGGFAVAIDGEGLLLFSEDGEQKMVVKSTGYRRIYDLAANEPGILWLARESSIEKLLYNDPVTVVDQRSEVVVGWPQVVKWEDQSVISSSGRLYDMLLSEDGSRYEFRELTNLPSSGAWAVAASAGRLLIGNSDGVFVREGSDFRQIPGIPGAERLFFHEDNLCIVINSKEIAAVRWDGSSWSECAPRLAGVGFPSVAHETESAIWLELGLDRVARIWFANGTLHKQVYQDFPWEEPVWVNVGTLKDHVVFSGANNRRVYLDARSGQVVDPPPIENALGQATVTILRVIEDENSVIWATHPNGVLTFHPETEGYRIDANSLDSIRDRYPVITLVDQRHAWISTESALYHIAQDFTVSPRSALQPIVVSISDGNTGAHLYSAGDFTTPLLNPLPYSQNHLVFRYFAGGYAPLQDPAYEFSMKSRSTQWTVQSKESLLTLPSLQEDTYRLTVQFKSGDMPVGTPIVTTFTIAPPWYRSLAAYVAYWSAALAGCFFLVAWIHRRTKRRHDYLETLVKDRTEALRSTMAKLTEEARTSATLAERNRLAGEIHDSLQQGLSGLALQLDATLKLNQLEPDIRARLTVARRMVSFTRQEVQQAVWDLESPLLENDDLSEALKNMASLISSGTPRVEVSSDGPIANIPSTTKHHLLRIGQEAITNAVRHSGAHTIRTRITFADGTLTLSIDDDGNGFDSHIVFADGIGHFGLRSLRTRATKIGGELTIESAPGQGTRVRVTIPLIQDFEHDDTHANELGENQDTLSR